MGGRGGGTSLVSPRMIMSSQDSLSTYKNQQILMACTRIAEEAWPHKDMGWQLQIAADIVYKKLVTMALVQYANKTPDEAEEYYYHREEDAPIPR